MNVYVLDNFSVQEREQELLLLRAQPIANNAWLKTSSFDNSLAEVKIGLFIFTGPNVCFHELNCRNILRY